MGIQIKNLYYSYIKGKDALKDINISIEKGAITALIGETGSGKSTLVQNLNALLIPTQGSVEVDDFTITNNKRKNKKIHQLRKKLALVFQFPEYQLFEETVLKDVAFGVKNFGASQEEAMNKAKEALKKVGINESYYERSPFELSGGEKRRVAIAGILAIEPEILVLDEPTAGLDAQGVIDIMGLVQDMHKEGKTIIIVTHDMDIVMKYCQNAIVLHDGEVLFNGKPYDLFDHYTEAMSIEVPMLYQLCLKLKDKGIPLDLSKINNSDDLVIQLNKWRGKHE
ncbi:MAG: energy-coupling factor transporter ATPase [Bacilli bacterium]|nr:energy-coupling factor transporter ATPase [Bacilli bacterium]